MKTSAEAFLDIETLPSNDPLLRAEFEADLQAELIAEPIQAPKNYKDPEKIAAYIDAERLKRLAEIDTQLAKTSLDGTYGRICAIGFAQDDGEPHCLIGAEEPVIREFFGWCAGLETQIVPLGPEQTAEYGIEVTWIGHNIRSFDLRFLYQRAAVLGIPLPLSLRDALEARWNGREMRDTMLMWNPAPDRRVSLKRLCRALGVPSPKDDLDGSKVAAAFAAGELDRIKTYSMAEIVATRACYRRLIGGAAK